MVGKISFGVMTQHNFSASVSSSLQWEKYLDHMITVRIKWNNIEHPAGLSNDKFTIKGRYY